VSVTDNPLGPKIEADRENIQFFGWRPSRPDPRDKLLRLSTVETIPFKVDNRHELPPCGNQGAIGSCVSWGTEAAVAQKRFRAKMEPLDASNLFIYWIARDMMGPGFTTIDSGTTVRAALKAWQKTGAPAEAIWPYDITRFADRPSDEAFKKAEACLLKGYSQVTAAGDIVRSVKAAIHRYGGVVAGYPVPKVLMEPEVAKTGVMPMPKAKGEILGGHCSFFCGYDDEKKVPGQSGPGALLVRNSWGPDWADGGYFWMPYRWAERRGGISDAWVVTEV
jgi:C1A family cysteine protease